MTGAASAPMVPIAPSITVIGVAAPGRSADLVRCAGRPAHTPQL